MWVENIDKELEFKLYNVNNYPNRIAGVIDQFVALDSGRPKTTYTMKRELDTVLVFLSPNFSS